MESRRESVGLYAEAKGLRGDIIAPREEGCFSEGLLGVPGRREEAENWAGSSTD